MSKLIALVSRLTLNLGNIVIIRTYTSPMSTQDRMLECDRQGMVYTVFSCAQRSSFLLLIGTNGPCVRTDVSFCFLRGVICIVCARSSGLCIHKYMSRLGVFTKSFGSFEVIDVGQINVH